MEKPRRESLLVVPAWYDPKARYVVFDATTIVVGLLAMDAETISYATDRGVQFAGRLIDVKAKWLRFAHLTRGCDLTVNGQRHRMYFARPLDRTPRASENQLTAMAEALRGPLATVAGFFWDSADILGPLLALPGELFDAARGIRNGDAVKAWLDAHRVHLSRWSVSLT